MYKWNGDNKLCIPGMNKIHPEEAFELEEEYLKNAGVKQLIKQGLITGIAQPEPTGTPATIQPPEEAASAPADTPGGVQTEATDEGHSEPHGDPTISGEETEIPKPDPVKPAQRRQKGR